MEAVILAGGLGTRLRPITERVPKPLVEVRGKPFLQWQLEEVRRQGVRRVLLLVSYLGEMIEAHFGDGKNLDLEIRYAYEESPLGTGGALRNAFSQLEEDFLLLNGDSYLKAPLEDMARDFKKRKLSALISVFDRPDEVPVIPNLKSEGGKVLSYLKSGGPSRGYDLIDSGVYVLKRGILETLQGKFQLEELWPSLIEQGKLGVFPVSEKFYDIGTPERLHEFEEYLSACH